jgi:hypothetical protein
MGDLIFQVQRVSDTAKGLAVRVGGAENVVLKDEEKDVSNFFEFLSFFSVVGVAWELCEWGLYSSIVERGDGDVMRILSDIQAFRKAGYEGRCV